jgi:hypothetical protein
VLLPKLNLPEYPRPDLFDLEFFCARQERVFVGDVENVEAEEDLIWRLDPPLKGGKASEHSEPLQNGKRMSAPSKNINSGLPCCSTLRVRSLFGSEKLRNAKTGLVPRARPRAHRSPFSPGQKKTSRHGMRRTGKSGRG